jgi:Concanavalin A-like lectin/glucanases superfamily
LDNDVLHFLQNSADGNMVRLYVDGGEIGNSTQADPPPTDIIYNLPIRELFLGAFEGATKERFTGDIAEVRIWNGALSSDEVLLRAQGHELP